ncbi:hypothetical protein IQ06DRAFT_334947 [Phaeosphaeriaceae sp. SRC1lsM3a]|nr:hypothetical protein IQ06DRAFT_334947 [Stagonospora sp. SRC1lsM3a]
MSLALSRQRPAVLREHTASSPTLHTCTPNTSYGFIPLGTATPQPTAAAENSSSLRFDYFSLPKKRAIRSPDTVSYEPHGFIPLCSVAGVERTDEACDCFSHTLSKEDTRSSTSSNSERNSIPPSPRPRDITNQDHFPLDQLLQPTGSPVHSREIFALQERMDDNFPSVRGGAIHDPAGQVIEAERSRCSLTGYPTSDSLESLELKDGLADDKLQALEQAVATHDVKDSVEIFECNDKCLENKLLSLEVNMAGHDAQARAIPEPLQPERDNVRHKAEDEDRESWEEDRLHIAMTFELPVSEMSEGDGNENGPVQTQVREEQTQPQPSKIVHTVVAQSSALPTVESVGDHRHAPSSSLQSDTPMPELLPEISRKKQLVQITSSSNLLSVPRPRAQARPHLDKRQSSPIPSGLTILETAMHTSPQHLSNLFNGPTVSITYSATGETYTPSISFAMLSHFCAPEILAPLLSTDATTLALPNSNITKSGLSRILRFMTRCCLPYSHSSSSELPIPTGDLAAGIETVLACRALGLHADATRLTALIISTQLSGAMSPTAIDEIWNGHSDALRSTAFGDAVVWFMLRESWKNEDGRAEEVMWMLEKPEFSKLKERVRAEVGLRLWRKESREEFLKRWEGERERREKKRFKKEMVERERVKRVEEIRRKMRERGADGRIRDEARAKADKVLDIGKALPKTPTTPTTPRVRFDDKADAISDADDGQDTTAAMYADYARSFRTESHKAPLGERVFERAGGRVIADRPVHSLHHRNQPSPMTWELPRAAVTVPRKKVSLWEKSKI